MSLQSLVMLHVETLLVGVQQTTLVRSVSLLILLFNFL